MSLFVEFHLIQNFAPSNLNRDDTGAPKDALFGGYRRARVSSQCFKRAIRLNAANVALIPSENQGVRTKKLKQLLEARLEQLGRKDAGSRIEAALAAAGLKVKGDGKTEYLLFLGRGEVEALAQLIDKHWDDLAGLPVADEKKTKKDAKKEAKAALPAEVVKEAKALLNGQKAVDVALFGRMLADEPGVNQDAACQVAHAISTHRVEREFDFFTALDDVTETAEMLDLTSFNSATFYRYAAIDVAKLVGNLQEDRELALTAIRAFTQAMARAIPSGHQNTFAAHNPPSFVGVVLRHTSPFNLANAFEKPVWPKKDEAITALSVEKLAAHDAQISGFYGDGKDEWAYLDLTGAWPHDKGEAQASLDALAAWVETKVRARLGA
jgi:CRISPR system Cascade subunit CasC